MPFKEEQKSVPNRQRQLYTESETSKQGRRKCNPWITNYKLYKIKAQPTTRAPCLDPISPSNFTFLTKILKDIKLREIS